LNDTITAIVLNYNQSEDLHFSIRSVIGQSRKFDEVIIYDDASNDDSVAAIAELIKGIDNTRLVELPKNVGPNAVVAIGIEEAKSDFVFFVSSNNVLNHHIVEEFHRIRCVAPDAMMISGNISTETQKKQIIDLKLPFDRPSVLVTPDKIEAQLSKGVFTFFGGANIIRRNCLIENRYLQVEVKWHADWLMYLLVALNHPVALSRISFCTHKFKRQRYSDRMYQVREQQRVTDSFIRLTKEKFPNAHHVFKRHGVLPFHSFFMLTFILSRKELRPFFSVKLAYYCLFFWTFKRASIFIPTEAKYALRKFFQI